MLAVSATVTPGMGRPGVGAGEGPTQAPSPQPPLPQHTNSSAGSRQAACRLDKSEIRVPMPARDAVQEVAQSPGRGQRWLGGWQEAGCPSRPWTLSTEPTPFWTDGGGQGSFILLLSPQSVI